VTDFLITENKPAEEKEKLYPMIVTEELHNEDDTIENLQVDVEPMREIVPCETDAVFIDASDIPYLDNKYVLSQMENLEREEMKMYTRDLEEVASAALSVSRPVYDAVNGLTSLSGKGVCLIGNSIEWYRIPFVGGIVRVVGNSIEWCSPYASTMVSVPVHVCICGVYGSIVTSKHVYRTLHLANTRSRVQERTAETDTLLALPDVTTTMTVVFDNTEILYVKNWITFGITSYESRLYSFKVTKHAGKIGHSYKIKKRYSEFLDLISIITTKHPNSERLKLPSVSVWHTESTFLERENALKVFVDYLNSSDIINDGSVIEFFREQ
jgi:hypothetical protein